MFYLICSWINNWVNNREIGDLRHHRADYDVTVMRFSVQLMYITHAVIYAKLPWKGFRECLYDVNRCISLIYVITGIYNIETKAPFWNTFVDHSTTFDSETKWAKTTRRIITSEETRNTPILKKAPVESMITQITEIRSPECPQNMQLHPHQSRSSLCQKWTARILLQSPWPFSPVYIK